MIVDMAERNPDTKAVRDYSTPDVMVILSSIATPAIQANNFELKLAIISMIQNSCQFRGLPSEDPNAHITRFLQLCDTMKFNGVSDDAIRLRLFSFSLRDKAWSWLYSHPPNHFTTWNDLAQKFLAKYFPPSKTIQMRNEITNFM